MNRDIKTGTIGLVNTIKSQRAWLTKGIQMAEGSIWNHAFLVIEIDHQLFAYEEGTIHGITITPLISYFEDEKRGDCILCFKNLKDTDTDKDKAEIRDFCLSLVGKSMYAWWQIPMQLVRQNLQKLGINWEFKSKGFICSVLVAYVLNKFYCCYPDWNCLAPDDLHDSDKAIFIQH